MSATTAAIAADYAAGATYRELQDRYHCQSKDVARALKAHGVTPRHRGGDTAGHQAARQRRGDSATRRPGRAVSIHCTRESRPCVIHDLPGACDACRHRYAPAGIVNTLEVEGLAR